MPKEGPHQVKIKIGDITGSGTTNVAAGNITQIFKTKTPRRIPRMIESPPPLFVGRESDVNAVLAMLKLEAGAGEAGVIAAVRGMGGVGKSTLVRVVAHHPAIRAALPGGVLKVMLGNKQELVPDLVEWGRQLGLDLTGLSKPESCKVALLSALSNKKLLLIIDDVWKIDQAAWFLVGGPGCRTLITTRLLNVAIELAGANVHLLQTLSDADSIELLTKLSPQALQENAQAAPQLASRLGGLPLALCLAGGMIEKEQQSFAEISQSLQKLDDYRGRLDLRPLSQDSGENEKDRSLRAILWLSYEHLPSDEVRRVFRLLGVFARKPGVFSLEDGAEVWGIPVSDARAMVSILVGLALVERASRKGYFTLHTLLTDFALLLMETQERLDASRCHAAHYLATCRQYRELESSQWAGLDIAWENIQASADWAAGHVSDSNANPADLELAVEYAVALDYVFQARKTQAAAKWFQAGVEASLKLGRKVDQGWLTLSLGTHALDQGKADEAEHFYQTSIDIFSQEGYELGVMYAQGNLGTVQRVLGKYPQALEAFRQVTEYCMQNTNPTGAALGFYNQADVKHAMGQTAESLLLVEQSLEMLRKNAGKEEIITVVLCLEASLNLELDQFDIAKSQVKEALEVADRMRAAHLRGRALGIQGELFCRLGQRPEAEAALQESIQLLTLIGVREELAEAHEIAARCAVQWRESDLARQHYQVAAQIFADMGAEARLQEVNTLLQAL